jgi:hypothetical protein
MFELRIKHRPRRQLTTDPCKADLDNHSLLARLQIDVQIADCGSTLRRIETRHE